MEAPPNGGSTYFNYKKSHSIVLLALADANYCFTYVYAGCNGRVSDGGVFADSTLSTAMETNSIDIPDPTQLPGMEQPLPFVIVGDDAFALKRYLMKPFPHQNLSGPARIFNYRLSRARRVVENSFGILSSVFRVFRSPINLNAEKTELIVLASCALHNFLLKRKESRSFYAPPGVFDTEDSVGNFQSGNWRNDGFPTNNMLPISQQGSNSRSVRANAVREGFKKYFLTTEGELSWQYRVI